VDQSVVVALEKVWVNCVLGRDSGLISYLVDLLAVIEIRVLPDRAGINCDKISFDSD
jgi:hypothetical protein